MATPFHVQVPANDSGLLQFNHTPDDAAKVSDLLQKDLEVCLRQPSSYSMKTNHPTVQNHHVFFNSSGYHNHLVHHLLTVYGTGGGSDALQKAYNDNASYQMKARKPRDDVVGELEQDWAAASKFLGKGAHYANFLRYFQDEIDKMGWREVVKEYLFKDDARSRDLFGRLFAGFLHPLIQLMYGLEWEQPALIASGLAQAAVHENRLGAFLTQTDEAAQKRGSQMGSIVDLFDAARPDQKLAGSAHWEDGNKIYDGVMVRAPEEAVEFLGQVRVRAEELEERTAEMVHTAAYVAAAATFHPPHIPKFDFFLMHHINSVPFFLTVNKQAWIPTEMKVRLLEWKIRMDITQYIARGCPPLQPDEIRKYVPKNNYIPEGKREISTPEELFPRYHRIPGDDGHIVKLARALVLAQHVSRKYADRPWIRIVDEDMWLRIHFILLDGTEHLDPKWVRSAGFEEAWDEQQKAGNAVHL
ncbi:hypothetical protein G7046_g5112 [Stylonectria norvegica]|nr:hypothetical protein G7046_g5112 [Stylonectria norvegica]